MADLTPYKVDLTTPQPGGRRGEPPVTAFTKYNDFLNYMASLNLEDLKAFLKKSQNLADLQNIATARQNLGLKTAALLDAVTSNWDASANQVLTRGFGGIGHPLDFTSAGANNVPDPNSPPSTWYGKGTIRGFASGGVNASFRSLNIPGLTGSALGVLTIHGQTGHVSGISAISQEFITGVASRARKFIRVAISATAWSAWEELVVASSLGTAAYTTVTTSRTDPNQGRTMRTGDFGFGGEVIPLGSGDTVVNANFYNKFLPSGLYSHGSHSGIGYPTYLALPAQFDSATSWRLAFHALTNTVEMWRQRGAQDPENPRAGWERMSLWHSRNFDPETKLNVISPVGKGILTLNQLSTTNTLTRVSGLLQDGSTNDWYVGRVANANSDVVFRSSAHNTNLFLKSDRVESSKDIYVGANRALTEVDYSSLVRAYRAPSPSGTTRYVKIAEVRGGSASTGATFSCKVYNANRYSLQGNTSYEIQAIQRGTGNFVLNAYRLSNLPIQGNDELKFGYVKIDDFSFDIWVRQGPYTPYTIEAPVSFNSTFISEYEFVSTEPIGVTYVTPTGILNSNELAPVEDRLDVSPGKYITADMGWMGLGTRASIGAPEGNNWQSMFKANLASRFQAGLGSDPRVSFGTGPFWSRGSGSSLTEVLLVIGSNAPEVYLGHLRGEENEPTLHRFQTTYNIRRELGANNDLAISQKAVTDALALKVNTSAISQATGTSTTNVMSQKAVTDALATKVNASAISQATGASTANVMSQKAVTDALATKVNTSAISQATGASTANVMSQKAVTDQLALRALKTELGTAAFKNIVGNVLNGDIMQTGEGHGGRWWRFANGLQICARYYALDGGGSGVTHGWPAEFIAKPYAFGTADSLTISAVNMVNVSTSSFSYISDASSGGAYLLGIGLWKLN